MIYTDIDLANLNRRTNQNLLIDALENFKGSNSLMYESNNVHFEKTTYTNYDNTEAVISKYIRTFRFQMISVFNKHYLHLSTIKMII